MGPFKIVCVAVAALALALGLTVLLVRPGMRVRRAGGVLRRMLEDPEQELGAPKALRGMEADLDAVRSRLLSQQEQVRREKQRQQDLIAFLAHDLKTPLTSVLGYLQLLHDEPALTAEQRGKYTGVALDKAKRLDELVKEFFDINTMDLALENVRDVQLSFLLEQMADEFYPLLTQKSLECHSDIAPGLVVSGDPDKLARVFDNVLKNAVSYSEPETAVIFTARRAGGDVVVTISNQGLEIPERELSNIFEKFYRLDAARSTRTGGAGLGLAIAKEIVERHGGTIRAESTGKRTTFTVALPAAAGR